MKNKTEVIHFILVLFNEIPQIIFTRIVKYMEKLLSVLITYDRSSLYSELLLVK